MQTIPLHHIGNGTTQHKVSSRVNTLVESLLNMLK